jgi:hypothetical protein
VKEEVLSCSEEDENGHQGREYHHGKKWQLEASIDE